MAERPPSPSESRRSKTVRRSVPDRQTATATDGGRSGDDRRHRIGLGIEAEENRRLLTERLSETYEITQVDAAEQLDRNLDLYIIDSRTYRQFGPTISQQRTGDARQFRPVLLLCAGSLDSLASRVWRQVDEVIATPVQPEELTTRIEGLLERRQQFVAIRRRQRMIRALHEATREMMQETDQERICQLAVDAARKALDMPLTAAWLADDAGRRLEPVANTPRCTDVFDELPVYRADTESLSWDAFESGETKTFDTLRESVADAALHNPETSVRSELVVPVGEFGVLNSGSTTPRQFDENDIYGMELLTANTATALDRAARERQLVREHSRLEFFHSILRHDVLNGMTVIQARSDALLEETADGRQRRYAAAIHDWSEHIVDVVGRVRTVLDRLTGEESLALQPVNLSEVVRGEVSQHRETYPSVEFETEIPADVTVRADELLADVIGNIVSNAVEHNDTTALRISLTVEVREGFATIRIADTGSGIPAEIKETVFRRGETGHAKSTGSGFGLFFVDTMITAYDGNVSVGDNDPRGTVFEIELPLAEEA